MITVHGFSPSGNCHKVRLLLEQLGRDYTWI
jgi:glutathione S-transferase